MSDSDKHNEEGLGGREGGKVLYLGGVGGEDGPPEEGTLEVRGPKDMEEPAG